MQLSNVLFLLTSILMVTFAVASLSVSETVLKIRKTTDFHTIFMFGDFSNTSLLTEIPTILFTEWTPLEITRSFNTKFLTIAFIDDFNTLDVLLSYLKPICAPKILLVSDKLSRNEIFHKIHHNSHPNAALLQRNVLVTFCCVKGNAPLEIYEIEPTQIFKESWIRNYRKRNIHWNNSYTSTYRTCALNSVCKVIRYFGSTHFGSEQIFLTNETANTVFLQTAAENKNLTFYNHNNFVELVGVVVVTPITSSYNDIRGFFILPFDSSTWLCYFMTLIYFALILSVVKFLNTERFDCSDSFLDSFQILLAEGVVFKDSRILQRIIILLMSTFGFVMVTLYDTFLGSFLIKGTADRRFEVICEMKRFSVFNHFQPNESETVHWKVVPVSDYIAQSSSMDSKYGYYLYSHVWSIFNNFQKHLVEKLFTLQYKSPLNQWVKGYIQRVYSEIFAEYLLNAYSSGLIIKWEADNYLEHNTRSVIKDLKSRNVQNNEMALLLFKWPSLLFLFLYLLGFVVFLIEILFERCFRQNVY